MTLSSDPRLPGRTGSVPCIVPPPSVPGLPGRSGRYVPHVIIVIVVVLAAVVGPPGQVEAALFALAAVLPLLGFRAELT